MPPDFDRTGWIGIVALVPDDGEMRKNGDVALGERIHFGASKVARTAALKQVKLTAADESQEGDSMAVQ